MNDDDKITISYSGSCDEQFDSNVYTFNTEQTDDTTFSINIDSNTFPETISIYNEVFVDHMPNLDRVNNMCKEYPALAKVYEQFKLIYKMTEQDYKGKLKERGIDDDIPF
jgi:hypothetical protein